MKVRNYLIKGGVVFILAVGLGAGIEFAAEGLNSNKAGLLKDRDKVALSPTPTPTITPTPTPVIGEIPVTKILTGGKHMYQTFNNCGPASLAMALSYYGINETQEQLGSDLRPYQVPHGDNDDKSVTLDEMADKSKEYGLMAFHRPNGDMVLLEKFIAYGMPVITRTLTKPNEDIGHYRVIKGYDQQRRVLVQDDSLQGKNLAYGYKEFKQLWKQFNYEYLVLVPEEKLIIAEAIMGEDFDEKTAWMEAREQALVDLADDSQDIYARFNLSIAEFNLGNYQKAVESYEQVESQLPFRTLWYQIEPIEAYYQLSDDQRVMDISGWILKNGNRAYSELYLLRGQIYEFEGDFEAAKREYELAVYYNVNLKIAQETLATLEQKIKQSDN